jgi:hypothetical protein
MSLSRLCRAFPVVLLLALVCPARGQTSDFNQYKDMRNPYLRVTNIEERQRTEERYVESGGKVSLQQMPYKEVLVTATLLNKPPSSLNTMFDSSDPYFKVCLHPFDKTGAALDDDCQSFRFQSLVRGNIGTAIFRLTPEIARYEIHITQKLPEKSSTIKLWNPYAD